VIDADQMWLKIPEYEDLAAQDWKTAWDRTYAEVRYLRDAALAEAAARRLDIILEISGDACFAVSLLRS
jgi:zeta toxin